MCSRGVLVHCLGRLGAAAAVLAAELQCGDGVFTKRALEGDKAVHHFDGVMSHSFNCSLLSRYDSEPKLPLTTSSTVKGGFCRDGALHLKFPAVFHAVRFGQIAPPSLQNRPLSGRFS
jgi:hypothetical protein